MNNLTKGIILVSLGGICYGILATFVKLAYKDGFTTAEVTSAQFVYGIIGLLVINLFNKQKINLIEKKYLLQLLLTGTSIGLTSIFYYLCVKYISVSVAIVLLMQSVWMGVLADWFFNKTKPNLKKISAIAIILLGTILATNLFNNINKISVLGIIYGLLAAISFTTTLYAANKVAIHLKSYFRTFIMVVGGSVIVFAFTYFSQNSFNVEIFGKYGLILALFGTILPPILMNSGFPHTGIGLGSILATLELPVSVSMAFLILKEEIIYSQWIGIILIILAILLINLKKRIN